MAQVGCDAEFLAGAVAELERLNAELLRRRWRALVGGAIPRDLGRPLTLRVLAYKLQAQHLGELDKASLRELASLGHRPESKCDLNEGSPTKPLLFTIDKGLRSPCAMAPPAKSLAPRIARSGTLLSREYGGVLHRVMVLDEGVSWNGKTFESLSKVAFAITGTKWNGPRFFGLRDKGRGNKDDLRQPVTEGRTVIGRGRALRPKRLHAERALS